MSPSGRKQPLHLPALGLEVASPHPQAVCGSDSVSIIILKPCEHCALPAWVTALEWCLFAGVMLKRGTAFPFVG